jgi:hypothetical protein
VVSYRESLVRIGIPRNQAVSYLGFTSRPKSLRQAIRSMYGPTAWKTVDDLYLPDEDWTDECQGVVFDRAHGHWIFSTNNSVTKGLYVFNEHGPLTDAGVRASLNLREVADAVFDHIGQICLFEGDIYVSHYNDAGSHVIKVKLNDDGEPEYVNHVQLDPHPNPHGNPNPEFQAINPWDSNLYTSFGGGTVTEFFIHDMHGHAIVDEDSDGANRTRSLKFSVPIEPVVVTLPGGIPTVPPGQNPVQGACFSDNGHLYVTSNVFVEEDTSHQTIWCYSALNGHFMGQIPIPADQSNQELEGITWADRSWPDGKRAQLWVILLENEAGKDNIFFKALAAEEPELV